MSAATWGAPGGISQAVGDMSTMSQTSSRDAMLPGALALQQEQILDHPVDRAYKQGQIAKQPAEIMNLLASSGLRMAEAGLKNEVLRQVKIMSEAMSSMSMGGDVDSMDPLDAMIAVQGNMAKAAIKSGAVEAAGKITQNLEQLLGHKATIDRTKAQTKHQEYLEKLDKVNNVGRFLNGVEDQATADEAAQAWFKEFKEPAPFSNPNNPNWAIPFNERRFQRMRDQTLTYQQKLMADNREDKLINADRDFARKKQLDTAMDGWKQAQIDLAREREDRLARGGGKSREPSTREVEDASNFISSDDPRFKDLSGENKKLFGVISKSVVYEAKKIYDKGGGSLTYDEALGEAWEGQRGKLEFIAPKLSVKIPFTDTTLSVGDPTLKLKGSSADNITKALPLAPEGERVQGQYYNVPGHGPRKWDPKGDPTKPWVK